MFLNIVVSFLILSLLAYILLRCLISWTVPVGRTSGGAEPSKRRVRSVFLFALGVRLAVLAGFAACVFLTSDSPVTLDGFLYKFQLWDARHYMNLIEQGYAAYEEEGRHIFLVFFPAYVWVSRLLSRVMPTVLAGLLVSVLSFSWGCCWVYRLGCVLYNKKTAWYAVLLLSFFPFSFFYGALMTEGLFLLSAAASCYFALKHRWVAFGLWGALAAATRMTGVLVMALGAVELLRELNPPAPPEDRPAKSRIKSFLIKLPLLFLPLLGTFSYLLLNWHVDGDPFAFVKHQEHWHQGSMWVSKVVEYIFHYCRLDAAQSNGWAIWIPSLALFAAFLLVLWLSALRPDSNPGILLFSLGYFTANYSLSWLLSAGRYLSCGFTLFILLAALTVNRPRLRDFLLFTECLFLGIYLFAYVNNAQIM